MWHAQHVSDGRLPATEARQRQEASSRDWVGGRGSQLEGREGGVRKAGNVVQAGWVDEESLAALPCSAGQERGTFPVDGDSGHGSRVRKTKTGGEAGRALAGKDGAKLDALSMAVCHPIKRRSRRLLPASPSPPVL